MQYSRRQSDQRTSSQSQSSRRQKRRNLEVYPPSLGMTVPEPIETHPLGERDSPPPYEGENQGENSQGDNSQGENSQGENSQGENSQGENSQEVNNRRDEEEIQRDFRENRMNRELGILVIDQEWKKKRDYRGYGCYALFYLILFIQFIFLFVTLNGISDSLVTFRKEFPVNGNYTGEAYLWSEGDIAQANIQAESWWWSFFLFGWIIWVFLKKVLEDNPAKISWFDLFIFMLISNTPMTKRLNQMVGLVKIELTSDYLLGVGIFQFIFTFIECAAVVGLLGYLLYYIPRAMARYAEAERRRREGRRADL